MPRRTRIPTKLAIAASPLVLAVGGLLAVTVRGSLDDAAKEARSSQIVAAWAPLNVAIDAIDVERGRVGETDTDGSNAVETNAAFVALTAAVNGLGSPPQLVAELTQASQGVSNARSARSSGDAAARLEFDQVMNDLSQFGDLLPAIAADEDLGRDLQALSALQRARQGIREVSELVATGVKGAPMEAFGFSLLIESNRDAIASFVSAAPIEWLQEWNASTVPTTLATSHDAYLSVLMADPADVPGLLARSRLNEYRQSARKISTLFDSFTVQITAGTSGREAAARTTSRNTILAASVAVLLAVLVAWQVTRSITRRIRKVSAHARDVATTQLPNLVEALRDPRGRAVLPQSKLITGAGADEVGELADSFNAMQTTLVGVAEEQMAVLRRGVSDIFVTLARRNRSLVDRQLALLDTLESDVDDPKVLGDYFKLDHLATRMRRNAESLLVLAHTETRHRRADPLGVDDVVRAAISEVEEYQRIDVMSMEPMTLKGTAVADMSHMIAELIDNAASFSAPTTSVRVSGHLTHEGYVVSISDQGMGISAERLAELNDLLATPPVIGLSVEPTLGLSVVSLLAAKHGVQVTLASSTPGISVVVQLPISMFETGAEAEPYRSHVDVPTHTDAATIAAPLRMSIEHRLAAELAITTPTPTPRLRRLEAGPANDEEIAAARPVEQPSVGPVVVAAPPEPQPLPVRQTSTTPLPVRRVPGATAPNETHTIDRTISHVTPAPAIVSPVVTAPIVAAPQPVAVAATTASATTASATTSSVTTASATTASATTASATTASATTVSVPESAPSSSPAGSSPNDVRDPAAMLNLGRPLLEGRSTASGLPMRTPGDAKPNLGNGDDRSVGVSQPDQVRANLAAFARGVTAAAAGTSLAERVATERAAFAARPGAPRTPAVAHLPRTSNQPPADNASTTPSGDPSTAERIR